MITPDQAPIVITEQQVREDYRIPKNQVSSTAFYKNFLAVNPSEEVLSSLNQGCAQVVCDSLAIGGRTTEPNQAYFSLKEAATFLGLEVKDLVQMEKQRSFPKFQKMDKNPHIPAWTLLLHRSVETWRNDQLNIRKVFGNEDHDMRLGSLDSLKHYPEPQGFMILWGKHKKD